MALLAEVEAKAPLVWNAELERASLTNLFFGRYGGMLRAVHGLLTKSTNRFIPPPDNVSIRHMLLEARARAVQVDATTQFAISAVLAEGTRRGLSVREIAYGTPDFPGIEGLFEQTWKSRPETVAVTELQHAMLRSNVDRFRALGGVTGYRASDGDYDQPCAARNGRIYPLDSPPDMNHPRCRLTIAPVFSEINPP
jgi:post-segregation antitoxin (ccd killing protein)